MTDPSPIRRDSLPSGSRVVTEAMPSLRSAAVGFWVGTGSRDEVLGLRGASHFLEHLLFKGTETRAPSDIAEAVESVGGEMNAFTTHELTAFYVRVPDDYLELALDVLSEVVWTPALRSDDVEAERQVILEELRMRDDAPDEVAHELFAEALFPDHALGRSVIGNHETITGMTRDGIAGYHAEHYRPGNVVVSAAGNVDHARVLDLVTARIDGARGTRPAPAVDALDAARPLAVEHRASEQAHVVVGVRGLARHDPDRHALAVLNQALGGGMSSRLFQEVRERRGLAYAVYSYRVAYRETGAVGIYLGTAPERVREALAVVEGELEQLTTGRGALTGRELDSAKGHLNGSMAMSLESSASRMHRIGSSELTQLEVPDLDELSARIEAVSADDVARVVERLFGSGGRTLAAVGPLDADTLGQ